MALSLNPREEQARLRKDDKFGYRQDCDTGYWMVTKNGKNLIRCDSRAEAMRLWDNWCTRVKNLTQYSLPPERKHSIYREEGWR